jgi:hypothetical protein
MVLTENVIAVVIDKMPELYPLIMDTTGNLKRIIEELIAKQKNKKGDYRIN